MLSSTRSSRTLIFRQLFERDTSTFTYLLGDGITGNAILIDPVLEKVERDAMLVRELDLDLKFILNTHIHADHVTGSGMLKSKYFPNAKSVLGPGNEIARVDIRLKDFEKLQVSENLIVECRHTPGHTSGCSSFLIDSMVFTGDALLIRGCGRTDFQQGNAAQLYDSIYSKLFTLPGETVVFPAHDYRGFTSSTIAEEKKHNPRLTKSKPEFERLMRGLNLPYPHKIDVSLPANIKCGLQEELAI